jgi:hypothetical protein
MYACINSTTGRLVCSQSLKPADGALIAQALVEFPDTTEADYEVKEITDEEFETYLTPTTDQTAATVRAQRNTLLTACDWTQLSDCPLSDETKALWATYRQELRDVPEQEGFPETVVWPGEPGEESDTSTGETSTE